MASFYRQQLERWLSRINVNTKSVLDIGGSANPVTDRVNSWKVEQYSILDNGVEDFRVRPTYNLDINYPIKITDTFDMIFCLEVMEYVFNPVLALMNMYMLLKTKGILYISFPAIYPVHNPKDVDCLRYTKKGVIKILSTAGFSNWEFESRIATEGAGALGDFYRLEKMHPVKHDSVIYDIGYMCRVNK